LFDRRDFERSIERVTIVVLDASDDDVREVEGKRKRRMMCDGWSNTLQSMLIGKKNQ
jgi:hypothetical protein